MVQRFVIISILIFLFGCSTKKIIKDNATTYSREELNLIADWKYGFDLKENELCNLYVFDGVAYDNIGIDSVLTKYAKSDLSLIHI